MNERIKALRRAVGLNQTDFASKLGTTQSAVSTWEKGINEPSGSTFALICRTFNCDEHWLRTGEGEMFRPIPEDERLSQFVGAAEALENPRLTEFLSRLVGFSVRHWDIIEQFMDEESQRGK